LSTFQRLNRRLFINANDDRVLRWIQVQADDVSRLCSKLRVSADAPTPLALKLDALAPQHTPHLVVRDIAELPGEQWSVPLRVAGRRRLIQQREDSVLGFLAVLSLRSCPRRIL
jgi:hypothetical protein